MVWSPSDDASDSEEDDEFIQSKGRAAFIFVIDALLFKQYERFTECLLCVRDALLNGILTREKDLIGIVLNNTVHSPAPKDVNAMENVVPHQNTAVLIPLRELSKETMDYYLSFIAADHFEFENKYGCTSGSFANMTWLCTNMFQQCGFKLEISNIFYFTDLYSPQAIMSNDFQIAIRKASDLQEINVDFNVVPMCDEFDYNIFYREFLCTVRNIELDAFIPDDPKQVRVAVANRMIRYNYKTRCMTYLRWKIGRVELAIGVYNFHKRKVYPCSVNMLREDNSFVEVNQAYKILAEDDDVREQRNCLPSDHRKMISIGGDQLYFTNEEVHRMRSPMSPGLRLVGFKPRSTVHQYKFLKSVDYIYPNEETLIGSMKLFRALWEKCVENDKIALGLIVMKRNNSPQYVALVPTDKKDLEFQLNGCSEGFHVWYLPFQTDVRKLNYSEHISHEDDQKNVELIAKLIKKLRIKYEPSSFKDPSLNLLHANIVDVAFDIKTQEIGDLNSLESLGIDEIRLNQIIAEFANNLQLIEPGASSETAPAKRKPSKLEERSSKVAKIGGSLSDTQIDYSIRNNTLDKFTVKQLKSYLQSKKVSELFNVSKANLVNKVRQIHSND